MIKNAFLTIVFLFSVLYQHSYAQTKFIQSNCKNGAHIHVRFSDQQAELLFRGVLSVLKQIPSEAGYRYGNSDFVLIGKGKMSRVENSNGRTLVGNCKGGAELSGTVMYLERVALPSGAVIRVELKKMPIKGKTAEVLASQTIVTSGQQVPISWGLMYDPMWLEPKSKYVIEAKISFENNLLWVNKQTYLFSRSGQKFEILLTHVQNTMTMSLQNTKWELMAYVFENKTTEVKNTNRPTVEFNDPSQLSGFSGCNRYTTTYTTKELKINFGPVASTRMLCEDADMALEAVVQQLLQETTSYQITGSELQFVGPNGKLLLKRIMQ